MRPRQYRVLVSGVTTLLVCVFVVLSVPASAAADQPFQVVASGLDNPRGLAFGPEGALYVVEAGRGGNVMCVPGPFGQECWGPSGAVTRIWRGTQERVATGLSSFASPDGSRAFGPHDISFNGRGSAYVAVGACFAPTDTCGRLLQVSAGGQWREVANPTAYEIANNPDGTHVESDPYAVLAGPGGEIVADAAGNDLLRVAANGDISLLAVFPELVIGGVHMDAVPTSVATGPDGALYVSLLTGVPFPVGQARVYRIPPGEDPYAVHQIYATGFTNIIDIAFGPDGSLYVLEHAVNGLLAGSNGALIRIKPDGTRETVVDQGLTYPTAVAIGADGAIYITNNGEFPGIGEVLRFNSAG